MKNKIIAIFLGISLIFSQSGVVFAAPELPSTPELPSEPELPELPDNYQEPEENNEPETPDTPDLPSNSEDYVEPSLTPEQQKASSSSEESNDETSYDTEKTGGQDSNGVSDPKITTGDANNTGDIYNLGNTNTSTSGAGGSGSSIGITNDGNGTDSTNVGSATVVNNNDTNQGNSAKVSNNMQQTSVSGKNNANENMGDVSITTGDANVTGTSLTSVNTNMAGVSVAEFNIIDNHTGDYVLDFEAGCISGCDYGDIAMANTGNGSDSENFGIVNVENNNDLDQINNGAVVNDLVLEADTGHNDANKNTGGDIDITTGDANVAANMLTFLNNNIAGGVMYGVVNVFGELIGDIILPDNAFDSFGCNNCNQNIALGNSGNGSESENYAEANLANNENINQFNDAEILNNLNLYAETGDNDASKNTGGNVGITTGESNLDASVLNIANMNVIGENMWLVVINEDGNWLGKLYGADSQFGKLAGSDGIEFAIDPNGMISATNDGNGAGSTNVTQANVENNNNINQENVGYIENNLTLKANTGENNANKNTGGDINIETGDANVLANVVNYLNNNIVGGKLLVTFVNVFGDWEGDFLTPGAKKDQQHDLTKQIGSMYQAPQAQANNNNDTSDSNSNSSISKATTTGTPTPGSVYIASGTVPQNIGITNSEGKNEIKLAGMQTAVQGDTTKKLTFNLAWLLVMLPVVLAAGIIGKKTYVIVKARKSV